MKKVIVFSILILLLFTSCIKMEYEIFKSYINSYYDYEEFILTLTDSKNIKVTGKTPWDLADWKSTGNQKKIYDNLCILHNDLNYNKKRGYIVSTDWGCNYKGTFTEISVISDKDFDEKHPAGSSLNDIVRFLSTSPKKFIDSNYKSYYDWINNYPGNFNLENTVRDFINVRWEDQPCYHPIDKNLSEITISDLALVEWFVIIFEKQPDKEKEHEITVTIKEGDGRVFTPNITMVFE